MIDWDTLQITVLDEDRGVLTETERIYSMQAEQVMVIMSGAAGPAGPRGPKGDKGDAGEAVWGAITGTLSNQTDLQDALDSKPSEAPADDRLYGRQNGVWAPISSAGVVEWGDISGTLSDQTDLQTAINGKLSDAPSDGSEYVRKNGAWAVSSGGGGGVGVWGSITGTLSNQTDLQDALNARLRAFSVAEEFSPSKSYPAGWNTVTYKGILYRFYGPYHDEWGHMTAYETISVKSLIDAKANTADLGAMASVADAPSDGKKYGRADGAWAEISEGSTPAWGDITGTLADQTDLNTALSAKADASAVYTKTQVDTALNAKADSTAVYTKSEVDTALGAKANSADVTASLALKADASAVYTKSEADTLLGAKANTADLGALATKDTVDYLTEIDNIPTAFPPEAHTHDDRYYTESEVDTLLSGKQSTLTFDSTPTASSTNPVTSGGIKTALDAKVNSSSLGSLATKDSVAWSSDITGIPSTFTPSSHTHGSISNAGSITTSVAIGSGDAIVITDSSDSNKLKKTSITFDGASDGNALTQKGTWVSFDDGISDSGWLSLPNSSSLYTGTIRYRKIGKLVQIVCTSVKLATELTSNSLVIDTVPSGYRPSYSAMILVQTYVNYPTAMMVSTNGQITFYKGNGNDTWSTGASINANGFYFVS